MTSYAFYNIQLLWQEVELDHDDEYNLHTVEVLSAQKFEVALIVAL